MCSWSFTHVLHRSVEPMMSPFVFYMAGTALIGESELFARPTITEMLAIQTIVCTVSIIIHLI